MHLYRSFLCVRNSMDTVCQVKNQIRKVSQMNKMTLYGDDVSPPVRFTMMTASLLNIKHEFQVVDLFKSENKTEFYKKINPLQKVPVLSVNGNFICDSHAIAIYFCRNTKDQELYPEDNLLKAKIDELLYFDSGVLFPIDSAVFSNFFSGKGPADEIKMNEWHSALDHLELKLSEQKWLTGNKMRLSDICCGATVSSMNLMIPLLERHNNVGEWLSRLNSLPCFEINRLGLKRLQSFIEIIKQKS